LACGGRARRRAVACDPQPVFALLDPASESGNPKRARASVMSHRTYAPKSPPSKRVLRAAVLASLREQGFVVRRGLVASPPLLEKDGVRALNAAAVARAVEKARPNLMRHERRLMGYLAASGTLRPERIAPRLVEVTPQSEEELLFRWARLHWSVPTTGGYGRRLRFVVMDEHNGRLIGLIGLGDGVLSLAPRDEWVGWTRERRQTALRGVMHAHILGAVPPYSRLLGGKLVAMLTVSTEVREAFASRYAGRKTMIEGSKQDGQLALITTNSALGRSSVYNRLRYRHTPGDPERLVFERVGLTRASAQAYFDDDLYAMLKAYAIENCELTPKPPAWGKGFRSRREVIDKALIHLGLSPRALTHGVVREVWCAPLAANAVAVLRGGEDRLEPYEDTAEQLAAFWRGRWLLPRVAREHGHELFTPESWQLWDHESKPAAR
jgi:hypothetical protein